MNGGCVVAVMLCDAGEHLSEIEVLRETRACSGLSHRRGRPAGGCALNEDGMLERLGRGHGVKAG
jgi:hypothetical protein